MPGRLFTGFPKSVHIGLVWADGRVVEEIRHIRFLRHNGPWPKTGIVAIIAAMVYVGGNGLNKKGEARSDPVKQPAPISSA